MDQSLKDEYFKRYSEIKSFVIRAFYDIFILEAFESYNTEISSGKIVFKRPSFLVLSHLCQAVMEDLNLSICKIYTDQDSKANTISHLNQFMHNKSDKESIELPCVKLHLAKELEAAIGDMKKMRNQFIAHLDNDHLHFLIPIKDITKVLYALRDMLNGLCIKEIDARVEPLDDDTLSSMQNDIVTGTELMLNGASWPIYPETSSIQTNAQ